MLSKNKNSQNQNVTNDLQQRARFFSRVLMLLFAREGITGKLQEAARGARHLSLGIRLAEPRTLTQALKLAEPAALASNSEHVLATRRAGLVVFQFELRRPFWQTYTRADLPSPAAVGLAERRRPILFEFSEARPHTMIAGATGSGKTVAIETALMAMLQSFTRDELRIVLVDVFNSYSAFENVSHLAIPRATTTDSITAALDFAAAELARRVEQSDRDAARLVVVIDEAERVLSTPAAVERIKQIAKGGRQFKVNLLLGSQQFKESDLPGVVSELNHRFVGLVKDAHTSARLTGQSGLGANLLTGEGDFLHVAGPEVNRFQVAQALPVDFAKLERVEIAPPPPQPTVVELPTVGERGRPKIEIDPALLAHYYFFGPQITHAAADEIFGLKRTGHNLHRTALDKFAATLLELRRGGKQLRYIGG